jgi:hypothetical protein
MTLIRVSITRGVTIAKWLIDCVFHTGMEAADLDRHCWDIKLLDEPPPQLSNGDRRLGCPNNGN